jgi:DNA-binding response OmpR family regulator
MRILVIEDDLMIGRALKAGLAQDQHATDWVQTAAAASSVWLAPSADVMPYDAVVVDLSLPDGSGLELIRKARARKIRSVILIVTARDRVKDRIAGLDAGADDYMVKPIDLEELSARLRAIDRRISGHPDEKRSFGALTIDELARVVTLRGQPVSLTAPEFTILLALARRPGSIVSRTRLEEALYNWESAVESNAIEVHIHRLRRKLGVEAIQTRRGQGYSLGEAS